MIYHVKVVTEDTYWVEIDAPDQATAEELACSNCFEPIKNTLETINIYALETELIE